MHKKLSISTILISSLTLTVVLVAVITVSLIYQIIVQKEQRQLEEKADEYLSSLTAVVEMPLWNLDRPTLKRIGEGYSQSDLVDKLKITDNINDIHFELNRQSNGERVNRSKKIIYQGQTIGEIEISLTAESYAEKNRQLLLSGLATLLAVVLVLVLVSAYLSRMFLKRLLGPLGDMVNAYASGRYDVSVKEIPFLEFQPLMDVLRKMGNKIESQMTDLRDAEKKYRSIFENAVEGIFQAAPDGRLLSANQSMARMLGFDSVEELLETITDFKAQSFVDPEQARELDRFLNEGKSVTGFHEQLYRKDGSKIWVSLHARPVFDENGQFIMQEGIVEDITEKLSLETQLLQSQKMEAIGQLAGGVAHDFNNMLSIILGYGEMLFEELDSDHPHHDPLQEIIRAGIRAKDLTRQLLAFSRKQVLEVNPVDVNDVIVGFEKLMCRIIGEDIKLVLSLTSEPCRVMADTSQLEQVFMNLAVNARDAMPDGGTLMIETLLTNLDEAYTEKKPEVDPSEHVMISVRDTGCGMDSDTMEHIFDPFFTTKEKDKGTGLGLATSYGIVKQHNGSIGVYSELKKGTTFKISLPIHKGTIISKKKAIAEPANLKGWETILLAEDNEKVRQLAVAILKGQGYEVISTNSGDAALAALDNHKGPVHMLLTDVIMPGMSGRELYERISARLPQIKALYMSGYTDDLIAYRGVLDEGIHFIQKPFSMQALAAKVRTVLDEITARPT